MGSNLDRPATRLLSALRDLSRALGPLRCASLYRTEPVSDVPQADFLNTVVAALTERSPRDLLRLAEDLEARAGRVPGERWGPRVLDVDVLLVGREALSEPDLVVPHPELCRRRFVLAPLADLAPGLRIPGTHDTVAELLARLPSFPRVERIPWSTSGSESGSESGSGATLP